MEDPAVMGKVMVDVARSGGGAMAWVVDGLESIVFAGWFCSGVVHVKSGKGSFNWTESVS
jgi:hypothetical protein